MRSDHNNGTDQALSTPSISTTTYAKTNHIILLEQSGMKLYLMLLQIY